MHDINNYISRKEAAKILGIAPRTLARWHAEGIGPPLIKVKRLTFYDVRSLTRWLSEREHTPCRS